MRIQGITHTFVLTIALSSYFDFSHAFTIAPHAFQKSQVKALARSTNILLHSDFAPEQEEAPPPPPLLIPSRDRRELPDWGKLVNEKLQMPMITHADKYHLHAFSAVSWFIGAYGHLFPAWYNEFQGNDWGMFSHLSVSHWFLMFSGTSMLASGITMLPTGKALASYSGQMRSAMSSCSALIAMSAAFSLQGSNLPLALILMSKLVATTSYIYMLYEGARYGRPWHILPIMNEMKLNNNNPFVITGAYGLSILWYWMAALCVSHGVLGGIDSLTDLQGSSLSSIFAAQMAISLAVAPANDALVAGTIMKNEAFLKPNKKRITLIDDPKVGLRQAYWLEWLQIVADYGPSFVTMGAAVACGHSELVSEFFYFDTIKELVFVWHLS